MIIQIDSTGTESLHIQCWIQWFATFHELFNINDHPLFIKCSIKWSSTFYQIVKSIDHPMSTNWWWTGHWLILKWSSTDWSNDHMIQWLHDPRITWSNNPSFYFFQRWLSTNLSNSPSISIYKLKSNNYFHSSCRSGHQPNSSRTAYFN